MILQRRYESLFISCLRPVYGYSYSFSMSGSGIAFSFNSAFANKTNNNKIRESFV